MHWKKKNGANNIEDVILNNLKIDDIDEINEWDRKYINNEYKLEGLKEACKLIDKYKTKRIAIFGDYDVDGRTASIIMFLALRKYGCRNVTVRIPRRFSEGYGMKPEMVDEVSDKEALVITVDNGIAAIEAIERAKEKGFDVIVTDHHEAKKTDGGNIILPKADIIIDPKAIPHSADFSGYCGAGIAYKLAEELLGGNEHAKPLLPLATIATIADVMELREENRCFVKEGLSMINKREAPMGIVALMEGMKIQTCRSEDIGFKIAPAINAPGRLNDQDLETLKLLCCGKITEGRTLAQEIIRINEERKKLVSIGVNDAKRALEKDFVPGDMIFVSVPSKAGILGIIAGRIVDEYHVPAIVFSKPDENGVMHGSARSVDGVDILSLISRASSLFKTFGGHKQAAGVSIHKSKFESAKLIVNEAFKELNFEYIAPDTIEYDLEATAMQVPHLLREQDNYEPFGCGCEKPVFRIKDFKTVEKPMKLKNNGIRLSGAAFNAFGFGDWSEIENDSTVGTYELCGRLSWNEYYGKKTPQVEIIDIVRVDKKKTTPLSEKIHAIR